MSAPSTAAAGADLLTGVGRYYSDKLNRHGPTPQGVDWNSDASQSLRFEQLLQICDPTRSLSINDLGCGYAGLVDRLEGRGWTFVYRGWDIAAAMIETARSRYANDPRVSLQVGHMPDREADYTLASGIFNVKLEHGDERWLAHILDTLAAMDRYSTLGFAFNCLTKYSDPDRMRDYLYYADPCLLFDYCKRRFSRNVALLHDYGLYEFTILVRKQVG